MKSNRVIWIFVLLVVSIPLLAFAGYYFFERKFSTLPILGKETKINGKTVQHTVSNFTLTDQNGKLVSAADWNNRIVVVDFFFTSCPTICPKMTANLQRVQESFGRDEVFINSFSVDPERDSASRLRWFATNRKIDGQNWKLLTGNKTEFYKLARNSFMIVATDGDGGPDDFIHSEKLVLVDRSRRIRGYYDGTSTTETDKLIADIKKLKHED